MKALVKKGYRSVTITVYDDILDKTINHFCSDVLTSTINIPVKDRGIKEDGKSKKNFITVPDKEFYRYNKITNTYIISMLGYIEFLLDFKQVTGLDFEVDNDIVFEDNKIDFSNDIQIKYIGKHSPYPYQKEFINKLSIYNDNTNLLELQTGKGKSLIGTSSIVNLSKKTMILVLARYISNWVEHILDYTDVKLDEILVLRGTSSLYGEYIEANPKIKIVLVSTTTLDIFDKNCEMGIYGKEVNLNRLAEKFSLGVLLIDEIHQEFHRISKVLLSVNIPKVIGLTATWDGEESVKPIMSLYFKDDEILRLEGGNDKYNVVESISYRLLKPHNVNTMSKSGFGYSQNVFEHAIMKNHKLKENYIKMIISYFKDTFIKNRSKIGKIIVFSYRIDMCEMLNFFIGKEFPELVSSVFVSKTDRYILYNSTIIFSTLGSAGTAVDIENLEYVLQLVNTNSSKANKQALGRLRKIPNRETLYSYMFCTDIPHHVNYANNKKTIFADLVNEFRYSPIKRPLDG